MCGELIQTTRGARRDGGGERFEIGVKPPLGAERDGHHPRAAGADDALVGGVDRFGDDDFVTGSGEALQRAINPALRARDHDDIVGGARAAGPPRVTGRDRLAQRGIADRRRVPGTMIAQRRDGRFDQRLRRRLVGVADGQKDHVGAGVAQAHGVLVNGPAARPGPGDPFGQSGKAHRGNPTSSINDDLGAAILCRAPCHGPSGAPIPHPATLQGAAVFVLWALS